MSTNAKIALGVALMLAWVAMTYMPPAGDPARVADIINTIKLALVGIGIYHIADGKAADAPADTPPNPPAP